MSFRFRRRITIDHTKCGTADSVSFPVLVSGTYSYLATVANGGKVTNASGFDIGFYADAALTQKLPWELESYTAATGAVIFWVQVPTLSVTYDMAFYMAYGDPSISASQATPTAVWDSNYKGVWHLNENAANTTVVDSTSNATVGAATANTSALTVAGQVGNGFTLDGSPQYVTLTDQASLRIPGDITISAWVKPTSFATYRGILGKTSAAGSPQSYDFYLSSGSGVQQFYRGSPFPTGTAPTAGVWSHVCCSVSSTTVTYYLNGASAGGGTCAAGPADGGTNARIGSRGDGVTRWLGPIDDVRLSATGRSASWIKADYNTSVSPSTFYAIGPEELVWFPYNEMLLTRRASGLLVPTISSTLFRRPVAAAPTSAVKTVVGVPRASVKTVDGLALASVKTIDGLA